MNTIDLHVKPRTTSGKGHARRSRAQGIIPGIVYGHDLKPKSISIAPLEIKKIDSAIGHNVFITLKVEGDHELTGKTVMIRDYQVDPLKHNLIHADFTTVDLNKPIVVDVAVELIGKPIGLAKQGVLTAGRREISVRCLPKDIPEMITVDVSHLDLLESLHIADVKMPGGVQAVFSDNYTIASVTATREEKVAEVVAAPVEGAAAAPGAAGAAGAAPGAAGAAAPAAGGKPGAAPAAGAAAPAAGGKPAGGGGAKK